MRLTLFAATLGMALAAFVILLSAAEPVGRCDSGARAAPAQQYVPARPAKRVMT